jgi:hypothetical protein
MLDVSLDVTIVHSLAFVPDAIFVFVVWGKPDDDLATLTIGFLTLTDSSLLCAFTEERDFLSGDLTGPDKRH